MMIKKGTKVKANKDIMILIMPPVLYGSLKKDKSYEVVNVNKDELDLVEISEGCREQVSISIEQLQNEAKENSVNFF